MKNLNLLNLCLVVLIFNFAAVAQNEVKMNPNAPADYDSNLPAGSMAIAVNNGALEPVKIVSKSGGVYKVTLESSPNKNVLYYKANSVYPYFDFSKLAGLSDEYVAAIEPYVGWYAAKHNLSEEMLKGDGFVFNIRMNENDLKRRLDRSLTRLAELESRLSEVGTFPQTFTQYRYNPAVIKEIVALRSEAFQAVLKLKTSRRAEDSVWLSAHRDGIKKALKDVNEYDPATRTTMGTDSPYVLYAVSPKARTKWLTDKQALEFKEPVDALLKPLADALAAKLPDYKPPTKDYAVRNQAEEAMMKRALTDPARYKIFSSGLMAGGWKIETNNLGIPKQRYKHGMIYLRDTQADHPYCFAAFVNIIQSYAGAGTYASSRPYFAGESVVACPAGK